MTIDRCASGASSGTELSTEQTAWSALQADALIYVVRTFLSGSSHEDAESAKANSTADAYQVVVHVDESALAGDSGQSDLPVESVKP